MLPTRLTVAMHEAGHAVVQLANPPAPYINSISITGLGEGLLGLVDTWAQWQPHMAERPGVGDATEKWRGLAWRDTIVHLAGPIAELRWRRFTRMGILIGVHQFADRCLGDMPPEIGGDLDRVRVRLSWAYPGEERERFNAAWLEAEEAVANHWRSIQAIGRLLHQRGKLTGEELTAEWAQLAR